jgi:Spy/CpxP family protein refolding chaperone
MHRDKYLALALAAGLAVAAPAAAQTGGATRPPAPADSSRRMMDPIGRLLEQRQQLKLTDDQARRLEAIRSKYQEKHQEQLERMRRERETRSAFRASMDSARAEVAAVLTPEQEQQVEAMREEWRREWRKGHKDRHHRGGHERHHDHDDDKSPTDG